MNTGHSRAAILLIAVFAVALLPAAAPGQSSNWTAPRTAAGSSGPPGNLEQQRHHSARTAGVAGRAGDADRRGARACPDDGRGPVRQDAGDAAFGDQFFNVALTAPETFTSSDGGTGNYNQFWLVEREFDNRTSLIVDPPNGRLPELTPAAKRRRRPRARAAGSRRRGPKTAG